MMMSYGEKKDKLSKKVSSNKKSKQALRINAFMQLLMEFKAFTGSFSLGSELLVVSLWLRLVMWTFFFLPDSTFRVERIQVKVATHFPHTLTQPLNFPLLESRSPFSLQQPLI